MAVTHPNAKLNIGLDILRKRPDGFHDIESLFVPYTGLADTLEIDESGKFSVEILRRCEGGFRLMDGSGDGDWDPQKDLTAKAYKLLKKDFPDLPPVRIRLEKNIPTGAGLGGGSADCAFALWMLSDMFDLFLPDEMLEIYAAALGSDCPFFLYNEPMLVSGRGEVLEPMQVTALDGYRFEVAVPAGISVSTKEAYAGIVPAAPEKGLRELLSLPVESWRRAGVKNDFEASVFAAHPRLAEIKEEFYSRGAVYASMSGSGSAIFGIFAA